MARFNLDLNEDMLCELKCEAKYQRRAVGDIIKALIYEWLVQMRNDKLQKSQLEKINGVTNGRNNG